MKNKNILLSIIVCTYNRSGLLATCLQSLTHQKRSNNQYEILVVDNNSTDDIKKVVQRFTKAFVHLRYIKTDIQGLSHARNVGWKNAKGKFIAYIDDDAYADNDWVAKIISFTIKYPKVNIFGGPYKRYFLISPPSWFPDRYGTLNLGKKIKKIHPPKEWLTGTNMIFNKHVFNKLGGFHTHLGMKGKNTIYGEETDLMLRLYKLGEQIYYVPTLRVNHLVARYKYDIWWLLKSDFFHSYSSSQFIKTRWSIIKGILFFLWSLIIFPMYVFNTKEKSLKTRVYNGFSEIFLSLGQIAGSIHSL